MAKTSMVAKQQKKQNSLYVKYTRCERCGRPHSVYRKFKLCRICFRELAYKGQILAYVKLAGNNKSLKGGNNQ